MLNVLHICNGYFYSNLYKELFEKIDDIEFSQSVVAPSFELENQNILLNPQIKVMCVHRSKNLISRLFFLRKIRMIYKYVVANVRVNNVSIIHAHTLFSDGAVALRLYKKYGIPYIVAVRNTDINIFFKYLKWYRELGYDILRNASKIICISKSYQDKLSYYIKSTIFEREICDKCLIIPNGIHDKWLNNRSYKNQLGAEINILYVGEFSKNKNIHSILEAVKRLRGTGINIFFTAVGKGLNDDIKYTSKLIQEANVNLFFKVYDVMDYNDLRNIMCGMDIFIMPSFHETFGLVYVEALSQGLPIIYSRNEGFDGFYDDGYVGYSVDPNDVSCICDSIVCVIDNYNEIVGNIRKEHLDKFNWQKITETYKELYLKYESNNIA